MPLVIDIGNTNTVFGLYEGEVLKKTWRVVSQKGALQRLGLKLPHHTERVVVSSVVPSLETAVRKMAKYLTGQPPLFVDSTLKMPIRIRTKNPKEVGADRIVNAVAAYSHWRKDLLIIDFGTATTFDVVTARGDYVGGVIAPGIKTAAEALAERCAKLPLLSIQKPFHVVGRTTKEAMRSGFYWGYVGLVDQLIHRIQRERSSPLFVVAAGGLTHLIAKEIKMISFVEPDLTLDGLRILSEWNR